MLFKIQHHKHAISIFDETEAICASLNKTPSGEQILICFKQGCEQDDHYTEWSADGLLLIDSRWTPEQVVEYEAWLKQKT